MTQVHVTDRVAPVDGPENFDKGASVKTGYDRGIAVIGLAGRLPGASDIHAFWDLLTRGDSAIRPIPDWLWDVDAVTDPSGKRPTTTRGRHAGLLDDVDRFDAPFFGIDDTEAAAMDPQHRLFLQEAWHALEDAGYADRQRGRQAWGVFVGADDGDQIERARDAGVPLGPDSLGGAIASVLAARIAHVLNLKGGAIAIDAACSSALVAVYMGCQSLWQGETDLVVAGGTSVRSTPRLHILCSQSGMVTAADACRPFDAAADGFVIGDAVASVVLKRVDDALRDGDQIYGVIRGGAMNHDGGAAGLSTAGYKSQIALLETAYCRAGIDPGDIDYVEASAAASPMGDAVEVRALNAGYKGRQSGKRCAIGSVKGTVGHCLHAAGITSFIKLLLSLRHRTLVPSTGYKEPSRHIDLSASPFYINTTLKEWPSTSDKPRLGAVSAFGFSGTNVHLVVEEAPAPDGVSQTEPATVLVPISAKTETALATCARNLLAWIDGSSVAPDLPAFAYTLMTRPAHEWRAAIVVSSVDELKAGLAALADGRDAGHHVPTDRPSRGQDRVWAQALKGIRADLAACQGKTDTKAYRGLLETLAAVFIEGGTFEPSLLFPERPQRLALPLYPFEGKSYWIDLPSRPARPQPVAIVAPTAPGRTGVDTASKPHGPATRLVVALLAERLDRSPESIPLDTTFVRLGLRSLDMVQMAETLGRRLGVALPASLLFDLGSVVALVAYVERQYGEEAASIQDPEPAITKPVPQEPAATAVAAAEAAPIMEAPAVSTGLSPVCDPTDIPLTVSQRGLWALQQAHPEMTAYNVPLCLRVSIGDTAALDRVRGVCAWIGRRWPILTSCVAIADGQGPVLRTGAGGGLPVEEQAAAGWTESDRFGWLSDRAKTPFDLDAGPLARVYLLTDQEAGSAYVLLAIHHLVVDGASLGTVVDGLRAATDALVAGLPMPQAEPLDGYLAAAAAEANGLSAAGTTQRLAYWRETLADLPEPLSLPLDHSRPASRSYDGASVIKPVPSALVSRVTRFAQSQGIYPSTLLLGSWQSLLARLSGQPDLVVGMPMSQRMAATGDLVGLFITMLPVRMPLSGGRPAIDALRDLQRRVLDGMANIVPFPVLVEHLGDTAATSGRDPVFQASFSFHDAAMLAPGAGADWVWVEEIGQEGEYELVLEVWEKPGSLELHFKYAPDLFEASTIARWAGHFLTLLEGMVSAPDEPVSALPLMGPADRASIVDGWGRGRETAFGTGLVPGMIAAQVSGRPGAAAVSWDGAGLDYGTLWQRSGSLARTLHERGIGRGDRVGLCLERGPLMLVGLLGILRAGACYVPLDPSYPTARLAYMVSDSGAQVIVGEAGTRARHGDLPAGSWLFVEDAQAGPVLAREVPLGPEDLAYVIYTSGSTGRPKGVAVSHGALSNFLQAMAGEPGLGSDDRFLAVTTVCFDIAGLELWGPLATGGTVLLCPGAVARDGQALLVALGRERPSVMQATPATWTMLFHAGWTNAQGVRVLCGGEALPSGLASRFGSVGTPVWNLYGPTEATIWSTLARVEPGDAVSLGGPLANTTAYVLDAALEPVPVGVTGDLYLGGAGLAQGYWGQPGRTASVFVASPFGVGERLYRTGDLARWRADGTLDYLGRADAQVKVQGHRVELGEIEARLEASPSVRRAAVVARAGAHGVQLVAWCEPAGAGIDGAALQAHLSGFLPGYMVPSVIAEIAALPLTANGKVDRRLLAGRDPVARPAAVPMIAETPVARPTSAALSAVEARLREIWSSVLEAPAPARDAGFFDVGGNSVAAVLLASRLTTAFSRPVRVTQVFQYPTLATQAAWLAEEGKAAEGSQPAPIATEPPPTVQPVPAAPTPSREDSTVPADALAIIGLAIQVPGASDPAGFWELLRSGTDSGRFLDGAALRAAGVSEALIRDPNYVPISRTLEGRALFDAGFFNLSPRNAALMDPQYRLLLQQSWAALEDAGYTPEAIPETAVFMATGGSVYHAASIGDGDLEGSEGYVAWLLSQPGTAATMVSYQLGLTGPSYAVHANCSSSLVGLQAAAQAIASGDAETALVGACSLLPAGLVGYVHEPGLNFASDGRCKTFDARADGMVAGEGVAVVLVKRARQALADGDAIYALVRGVASNNDGQAKAGFYAPSVSGQAAVIGKVLERTGIDAATIGYVEAHGTGTSLGDPIEVQALSQVYRRHTDRRQYCAIGAVKSNLGHLDTAAGLAGLAKVALSLHHGAIAPTLHYDRPNPEIDFAASPFRVAETLTAWPAAVDHPRRAALSAFGIGGTNTHAVLEQAPVVAAPATASSGPVLIVLSARDETRLAERAQALARYLDTNTPDLRALAFTLQTGRRPMAARLAFVAATISDVRKSLTAYCVGDHSRLVAGTADPTDPVLQAFEGDAAASDLVARWIGDGNLEKIAALWVRGMAVDWSRSYPGGTPQRVHLPTYPFAPEHHWRERPSTPAPAVADQPTAPAPVVANAPEDPSPVVQDRWDGMSFITRWEPAPSRDEQAALGRNGVMLIVAPAELQLAAASAGAWYGESRPDAMILQIGLNAVTRQVSETEWLCRRDDADGFATCLGGRRIDTVIFLCSANAGAEIDDDQASPAGPMSDEANLLRLFNVLRPNASSKKPVNLYLVTVDRYAVADAQTGIGGISGLGYAIAQGDRLFRVRNIDVSKDALAQGGDPATSLWPRLLSEPPSDRGTLVKFSKGERFELAFHRLEWEDTNNGCGLRQGGVYLIVGGAGTVGRVVSRYLIDRYRAQIVWIGRRSSETPEVKNAFASVGTSHPTPIYVQADVCDLPALRQAIDAVIDQVGPIDGAFHSAMEDGAGVTSSDLTEDMLRSATAVKSDGSLNLYRALSDHSLDFLCYFSSVQAFAFFSARDSAGYAAAVSAGDSVIRVLQRQSSIPIGLIHWGYWQASLEFRPEIETLIQGHYQGIDNGETCRFLDRFLGALAQRHVTEAVCLKASDTVHGLMPVGTQRASLVPGPASSSFLAAMDLSSLATSVPSFDWGPIEARALALMAAQLRRLGTLEQPGELGNGDDLRHRLGVVDRYHRWWDEVLTTLLPETGRVDVRDGRMAVNRPLTLDDADAEWDRWDQEREAWLEEIYGRQAVPLLELCLKALPEILTGKIPATDIIFPEGSLDLVAGLYRGTPFTDSLNDQIARTITALLAHRRNSDPHARLRILEIGAGTGGTTMKVIPALDGIADAVAEYCFTDVSNAFLIAANKRFGTGRPWFRTTLCDVEKPLEDQGIELGAYDIVVSTNCLHATRDIRATLRHASSALSAGGLLIANEGVDKSIIGTLIFGLLDGWWRYDDGQLRVSGSPLLSSETWQRLMREQGLTPIGLDNPGKENQQVIVAESTGVILRDDDGAPLGHRIRAGTPPGVPAPHREEPQKSPETRADPRPASAQAAEPMPADVSSIIRTCLAETLKADAAGLSGNVAFSDVGVDSILGVSFVNRLNEAMGIKLNRATIYDYTTIDQLAEHLRSTGVVPVVPDIPPATQPVSQPAAPAVETPEETKQGPVPIAVVGMSAQLPGASSLDEFWQALLEGRDCVRDLPDGYVADGSVRRGGLLAGRDGFDAEFFGLSKAEVATMGRHQRLVLEEGWHALENAGIDPRSLAGSTTAVYVGAEPSGHISGSFSGDSDAIVASRLSYLLDLKGPALAINTACSAGAVAIHLACEGLRHGTSDLAVAGGVAASLSPEALAHVGSTDMLSPTGQCRPFAADADGTVLTEAVAMVVLKRLAEAMADGDPIHGVIIGSGMNQDGASNGITAPNGRAQEALLVDTWRRFDIAPETITHMEGHGTGTPLGDAVEGNAINRALRQGTDREGFCTLGTAKTHLGHTGAASGVVGLIKLLLALRHRTIPGPLTRQPANPMIELDRAAVTLAQDAQAWQARTDEPRTAGLNAFGHSGTNVHIVVQEPPPIAAVAPSGHGTQIIPLSAPSEAHLTDQITALLAWLRDATPRPSLEEVAWTLQTGRTAFSERLVVVASGIGDLEDALERTLRDEAQPGRIWRGTEGASRSAPVRIAEDAPDRVADAWVSGASIDWSARWTGDRPRRIAVPGSVLHKSIAGGRRMSLERAAPSGTPAGEIAHPSGEEIAHEAPVPASTPEIRAEDAALSILRSIVATERGKPISERDATTGLRDLGLTSQSLVTITAKLEELLGQRILPSVLFDHPTIRQFAAYLAEKCPEAVISAASTLAPSRDQATVNDDLLTALEGFRDGTLSLDEIRARVVGDDR